MLKIYYVHYEVSVDQEPPKRLWLDGCRMRDEGMPTEETILDNVSFADIIYKEVCQFGINWYKTLFTKKPIIEVYYQSGTIKYKHFNTLTYKRIYTEAHGWSLERILKTFPAEQCIQYLKEHGLNTCPIIKE